MKDESLHEAAAAGDLLEVIELIQNSHDLNAFDDISCTPLHHAVRGEHYGVIKLLLQAGADINSHEKDKNGETPLGEVADKCSLKMARTLIDAGANPTVLGWMHITALHRASKRTKDEGKKVYQLLQSVNATLLANRKIFGS